ncbi:MAG TPA: ABC transporter substrate-binding protein [Dongiaceae bacterium]|nr:ABC transporter substrate-binding protein [Dongiaceae bacterium]
MGDDFIPRRVVCLQPSATLTMRDIGMLDRVVACTRYCADVCPEVIGGSRVFVSDSWAAQAREIQTARPDIVIASVPYQMESVGEILKSGIRFLGLAPRSLAEVYSDIAAISAVMGATQRGANVIAAMQIEIESVHSICRDAPRPRVFCEEWGKPIIASQPWVAELVECAGGEFVATPGKAIAAAEVASLIPDVLLAAWCGAGDRVPMRKMVHQRNWANLPAVRAGRVFCIRDELLNTPASNLLGGLRAIAWALHPERFACPAGIHRIDDAPPAD